MCGLAALAPNVEYMASSRENRTKLQIQDNVEQSKYSPNKTT